MILDVRGEPGLWANNNIYLRALQEMIYFLLFVHY